MKLYMFYMGGTVPGANIEAHDMQFVIAEKPEDAFPSLAKRWFGEKEILHVDVITPVTWADGYDVSVGSEPDGSGLHLFFVNMGAYLPGETFERHSFDLFVAKDEAEAKRKAKEKSLRDHYLPHRDYIADVDDCLSLDRLNGMFVNLRENPLGKADEPVFQGYRAIGSNYTTYDPVADVLIDMDPASPA